MLFSIIMPAYNAAKYIVNSIESVINQTYNEWELLIINDGSVDDTEEIVLQYAQRESRICYIHQENGGVSSARNHGLDLARGEYILFVDSDDEFARETLQTIKEAVDRYKSDIVVFNAYRTNQQSQIVGCVTEPISHDVLYITDEEEKKEHIFSRLASNKTFGIMGIFAVNRNILKTIRFRTDMKMYEDLFFDIQMYELAKTVVCLPQYFYYYRDNPSGCVNNFNYRKIDDLKIAYAEKKRIVEKYSILENNSKIVLWFCLTILSHALNMVENKKVFNEYVALVREDAYIVEQFMRLREIALPSRFISPKIVMGNCVSREMLRMYNSMKKKIKRMVYRLKGK